MSIYGKLEPQQSLVRVYKTKIEMAYIIEKESEEKEERSYMSSRYQKSVAKGICGRCHKYPFVEGRTSCQICLDGGKLRSQNLRSQRLASGMCTICGVVDAEMGKQMCVECATELERYNKRRRDASMGSSKCPRCHKRDIADLKATCVECADWLLANNQNRRNKYKQKGIYTS